MAVLIENRQRKHTMPLKKIKKTAQAILDALDYPDGELSLLLLDDRQIAELNREFLQRQGPTNVIAFPMREGRFAEIAPHVVGDVVISIERAHAEAEAGGLNLQERFNQLLVHGILHLFGYDHEQNEGAALEMEKKSRELLGRIADC